MSPNNKPLEKWSAITVYLTHLSHERWVDMDLGARRGGGDGDWPRGFEFPDGPGGVECFDLLVQLVELLVREDLVAIPPGQPKFVQQRPHLRGRYLT